MCICTDGWVGDLCNAPSPVIGIYYINFCTKDLEI